MTAAKYAERSIQKITSESALSLILTELGRKTLSTPFNWMHTTTKRVCCLQAPKPTEHWWHDVKAAAADTGGMNGSTPCTHRDSRP